MNFKNWLLKDILARHEAQSTHEPEHPWWCVMCLTGVDYFSTLGYQPGIAFLAAGILSPIATFVLVLVTLLGALPVYCRVAEASPNGQGSIHMLEGLFSRWKGKSVVLILLGFAATDFVITMTLSAADAATHFIHNPLTPPGMHNEMGVTLVILGLLGVVFLMGFREAIGIAVVLVGTYLVLNAVAVTVALWHLFEHPELISGWSHALLSSHSNPLAIVGISLILFPKLALGLSGFETGVAVMPLVKGMDLKDRIRNTRKLLVTAAVIMSVFLMATSIVSTLLIPAEAFREHGPANGRAMSYLAHEYMGNAFGSLYDISTILILAFAGASAMAGLLNLIPRYLPGFGMAPEWALASRPLVLVFTGVAFAVTWIFDASVDAQGSAYATGVLVLITSAAFAVAIAVWRSWLRWPFGFIALLFVYTTLLNMGERPEGVKIASFFIASIIFVSMISRAVRSTELRITGIHLDEAAIEMISEDPDGIIRIVAKNPMNIPSGAFDTADAEVRSQHNLSPEECLFFFLVEKSDASKFETTLTVHGRKEGRHRVLYATSPVVANSIAALLIELENRTGQVPHAYFSWREGNPVTNIFRFIFLGEGDTAPLTHEVLRRAVSEPERRPIVHVS
ncbi:amino acid transporter [Alloacidobacterium sp.]|uniref:amino acid transporter n=1 Tax=Alloacidobacterium sp. TaxID=2951999 RepID=UPI002D5FE80B|nr:amino acid transporter [Alloacidobacterium sp.]HYK35712.1 amino acid transporter [Alloacidobacterium sp.]